MYKEFAHPVMRYYSKCLSSLIEQTKLDVHFDKPNYFSFKTANGLRGKKPRPATVSSEKTETQRNCVYYPHYSVEPAVEWNSCSSSSGPTRRTLCTGTQ